MIKKLSEVASRFIELDDHKGRIFLDSEMANFVRNYKNTDLTSLSLDINDSINLLVGLDELFFLLQENEIAISKNILESCLLLIVQDSKILWHRTHISTSSLKRYLKDNPDKGNYSLNYYLEQGDRNEDVLSRLIRTRFGGIKEELSSIFINIHSSWYKDKLSNMMLNETLISENDAMQKRGELNSIKISNVHACLVVYLYLRSKNVSLQEIKSYLPRVLYSFSNNTLAIKDNELKDQNDKIIYLPNALKVHLYNILITIRQNNELSFTSKNYKNSQTLKGFLGDGQKNANGFNLISIIKKKGFESYIGPIIHVVDLLKEPYKSDVLGEIDSLKVKKIKYFSGI